MEEELEAARDLVKYILKDAEGDCKPGEVPELGHYNLAKLSVYDMRKLIDGGCLGCKLDELLGDGEGE